MDPQMDPEIGPATQVLGNPDQINALQAPIKVHIDHFFTSRQRKNLDLQPSLRSIRHSFVPNLTG